MKQLLFSLFLIQAAFSGTMTVKGISNIGKAPDFVELRLEAVSKCFLTAKESNKAVSDLNVKIQKILKKHTNLENGDQLIVVPGISSRQDETKSVFDSSTGRNRSVTVCEKGWRSSRSIISRFSDLTAFELINPDVFDLIDKVESKQRAENNGVVSLSISQPLARLLPETIESMEELALKESLSDASDKFQVVKELCDLKNASISKIEEAGQIIRPYSDNTSRDTSVDDLHFSLQYVHLAYNITFHFESAGDTCGENTRIQ